MELFFPAQEKNFRKHYDNYSGALAVTAREAVPGVEYMVISTAGS